MNANADMPVEKILEAEIAVEPKTDTYIDAQVIYTMYQIHKHQFLEYPDTLLNPQ